MIDARIYPGMELPTYAFGIIDVKKVYTHPETGETCLDCKSATGDILHLSLKYAVKLLERAA